MWKEKHYTLGFYVISIICLFGCELLRIIAGIPYVMGLHENIAYIKKLSALVTSNKWLFIFTIVTAAVTEELLIRGYMLPRLALFFKHEYIPIFISAIMFSTLHLGYHSVVETIFTLLLALFALRITISTVTLMCLSSSIFWWIILHFITSN